MALRSELGSSFSRRTSSSGAKTTPWWKVAAPAVIILAAVGWIVYLVAAGGEARTIEVTPAGEVMGRIITAIGDREDLLERVNIRLDGEPPNQVIKIDGAVKTKAMLDELKSKVDGAKGDARVEMNVSVKP